MIRHLAFAILCMLAAGCATTTPQRDATEAFGLATERIGRLGEDEFISLRNGIVRLRKLQAVLDTTATSAELHFDASATALTTADRISACKSLRMYGDLLMRLASDDRTQFVRRSAITFMDSVGETLGTQLNAEQEAAIDYVIEGLSRFWTERRKAESIRKVVLAYEDVVNDLTGRIQADFVLDGPPESFLLSYNSEARQLQDMAARILDTGGFADMSQRRQAVNAHFMAQEARVRAKEIGLRMRTAIQTLRKANAEIVACVHNDACDAGLIKEYGRQIQKIANLKQILPK